MNTTILVCPFAQFGNPGTQAGAELLADALREMLADNADETRPTRAHAYQPYVRLEELPLATPADYARWHLTAQKRIAKAWDNDEFLIWIGGNHLSVMPVYEELGRRAPSAVVQFDAHLDVYHHDDCVRELSHGNFIAYLPTPKPTIINVGHRDQFLLPKEIGQHFAAAIGCTDMEDALAAVTKSTRRAKRIILDIDWDVLDSAYFPAVVDALPFGLAPSQLLNMMRGLWSDRVCGLSLSEFDPGRDDRDRSLQLAVWLMEQVLLWRHE